MKLVFMGTPDFAVPSLRRLAASRHQILGVVTNPDRPRGRGRKLAPPPVKVAALELGLEVLQPESVDDPDLAAQLERRAPDLFAVVAFSVLPPSLLAIPRCGAVNLHPSLLPAYRGAAPIIWSVINGEEETGLTTFLLNERVDSGKILLQHGVPIAAGETAGELEARLGELGAELLVETVDKLEQGEVQPRPQARAGVTRAPKLTREDGRIDWSRPAETVRNRIRGTNPVPGAFTEWPQGLLKVHRAHPLDTALKGEPGTVLVADSHRGLAVAAGDGVLLLSEVQPAGRPRMEGSAFVRGYHIAIGTRFGCAGQPGR